MESPDVSVSRLRSTLIVLFSLLSLLAGVGVVQSLSNSTAATKSKPISKSEFNSGTRRSDSRAVNRGNVPGPANEKKTAPQNPKKSGGADQSQAVEQRGAKEEAAEHYDIS